MFFLNDLRGHYILTVHTKFDLRTVCKCHTTTTEHITVQNILITLQAKQASTSGTASTSSKASVTLALQ